MHAILHIRTSFHRTLGKKTLAVVKNLSGRPILLCSLAPRSKKMTKRAYQRASAPRFASIPCGDRLLASVLPLPIGSDLKKLASPTSYIPLAEGNDLERLPFLPSQIAGTGVPHSDLSLIGGEFLPLGVGEPCSEAGGASRWDLRPILRTTSEQSPPNEWNQQSNSQKRAQPGVKRTALPKWSAFSALLAFRSSNSQSQRRGRRLKASFLKELASRQSSKPLVHLAVPNTNRNGMTEHHVPSFDPTPSEDRLFARLKYVPSIYSNKKALGVDLVKSLQRTFSPRLRYKSDRNAKLLGIRFAKACMFKGIQTVDVVIQEYTRPTCLLLQGLRMAGVRFNRLRILKAVGPSYEVPFLSDRERRPLVPAKKDLRSSIASTKKKSSISEGSDFIPKKSRSISWLLDVSPKDELLRILIKSRLIKTSTRHTFWQAKSFKYKIEKLLYRKNQRAAIREKMYASLTQKEAIRKWKDFQPKKQQSVRHTPSYRLSRSFAPFFSKSPSIIRYLPQNAKEKNIWMNPKKRKQSVALKRRQRFRKNRHFLIANIQNTLNNTIITITDRFGNTKIWCSSGSIGLKASRRSTNYAAQSVAEAVAKKCRKLGIRRVEARVQGVGYGKPSALKGLRIGGLQIKRIVDTTPKPHNGCRAPSKRRV